MKWIFIFRLQKGLIGDINFFVKKLCHLFWDKKKKSEQLNFLDKFEAGWNILHRITVNSKFPETLFSEDWQFSEAGCGILEFTTNAQESLEIVLTNRIHKKSLRTLHIHLGGKESSWTNVYIHRDLNDHLLDDCPDCIFNEDSYKTKFRIEFQNECLTIAANDKIILAIRSTVKNLSWISAFKYFGFTSWDKLYKVYQLMWSSSKDFKYLGDDISYLDITNKYLDML